MVVLGFDSIERGQNLGTLMSFWYRYLRVLKDLLLTSLFTCIDYGGSLRDQTNDRLRKVLLSLAFPYSRET